MQRNLAAKERVEKLYTGSGDSICKYPGPQISSQGSSLGDGDWCEGVLFPGDPWDLHLWIGRRRQESAVEDAEL